VNLRNQLPVLGAQDVIFSSESSDLFFKCCVFVICQCNTLFENSRRTMLIYELFQFVKEPHSLSSLQSILTGLTTELTAT